MSSYYEKILATGEVKCIDEEILFEIPTSWSWARLIDITSILGDGIHGTPKYDARGTVYFINGNNLSNGSIEIKADTKKVMEQEAEKHKRPLNSTTVLVSINGTLGNIAFYNGENVILGKSACYFNLMGSINKQYIKYILETEYFTEYAKNIATGSTIRNVPLAGMRNFLIPVPPITEQLRIILRIDQLANYIARYNDAQTKLDLLNNTLKEKLKKAVLQNAIQGKLVPQIAEEGTAQELLEQIKVEKQKLVKEGKLKKSALNDSLIFRGDDNKYYEQIGANCNDITDEIPFNLPNNWTWCRLGNLISITSGENLTSKQMHNGKIPVYGGNGITGYHSKANVFEETIVIGRVGYYCGSIHLTQCQAWVTDNAFITQYSKLLNRNFLIYLLTGLNLGKCCNATAQPVVSGKKIYPLLIGLPPLKEQQRIVAQIEKLFEQLR